MSKPTLQNWAVVGTPWGGIKDGLLPVRLNGNVYGDPRFEDGTFITTSRILTAQGRMVQTRNGTRYHLGRIDPKYRRFLRKDRPRWDWRNPVTMINPQEAGKA